jgi:hypothetical protein
MSVLTETTQKVLTSTAPVATDDHILDDVHTVAAAVGVHRGTLQRWRTRGLGPDFVLLSRRKVAYQRGVWRAWLRARTASATSI